MCLCVRGALTSSTSLTSSSWALSNYRPQQSWGKVIFSEACVKNSVHRGQGVCMAGGACVAGGMCSRRSMHGRGHAWGVWQGACMTGGACHAHPNTMRYGWSMRRQYASYWNAFLLPATMKLWPRLCFLLVCVILFTGVVLSQHALQVVSQHALQQVSRGVGGYPSMPCRLPGPHPRGKFREICPGGCPGPHPRGALRGNLSRPTTQGGSLGGSVWGVSRAHTQGGI